MAVKYPGFLFFNMLPVPHPQGLAVGITEFPNNNGGIEVLDEVRDTGQSRATAVEPIQHRKAPPILFIIDLLSIKVAADLCLR